MSTDIQATLIVVTVFVIFFGGFGHAMYWITQIKEMERDRRCQVEKFDDIYCLLDTFFLNQKTSLKKKVFLIYLNYTLSDFFLFFLSSLYFCFT